MQETLEKPSTLQREVESRAEDINALAERFVQAATPVVERILAESHLPKEARTVKVARTSVGRVHRLLMCTCLAAATVLFVVVLFWGLSMVVSVSVFSLCVCAGILLRPACTAACFCPRCVQPIDVGGVAGGVKFLVAGQFFKFALDEHGLFGSDVLAAKGAGLELQASRALSVHHPLPTSHAPCNFFFLYLPPPPHTSHTW